MHISCTRLPNVGSIHEAAPCINRACRVSRYVRARIRRPQGSMPRNSPLVTGLLNMGNVWLMAASCASWLRATAPNNAPGRARAYPYMRTHVHACPRSRARCTIGTAQHPFILRPHPLLLGLAQGGGACGTPAQHACATCRPPPLPCPRPRHLVAAQQSLSVYTSNPSSYAARIVLSTQQLVRKPASATASTWGGGEKGGGYPIAKFRCDWVDGPRSTTYHLWRHQEGGRGEGRQE